MPRTTLKAHGRVLAKIKRPLRDKPAYLHIEREEVRVFMEDGFVLMATFYRPVVPVISSLFKPGRRRSTGWRVMVQHICTAEEWLSWKLSPDNHIPPFTQIYPPPNPHLGI